MCYSLPLGELLSPVVNKRELKLEISLDTQQSSSPEKWYHVLDYEEMHLSILIEDWINQNKNDTRRGTSPKLCTFITVIKMQKNCDNLILLIYITINRLSHWYN